MSKAGGSALARLRSLMRNPAHVAQPIDAYIIPTGDAHQSEYVAECDQRRAFITGFTGSAGTAVVTTQQAALWTDGRYHLQAGTQLSQDWTLMKEGLPETPSRAKWLSKVLPVGGKVGCDPTLLSFDSWCSLGKDLRAAGHLLVDIQENLVDLAWPGRPPPPAAPLTLLSPAQTGLSWQQKVEALQGQLAEAGATALAVTSLDQVAWLFNMRGADIQFNPVFFSFAVVTLEGAHLFISEDKLTPAVQKHLKGANIHAYADLYSFLSELGQQETARIWLSDSSSYAVVEKVPKMNRYIDQSPIAEAKAIKNKAEMEGMERAQVKDAVALCEFLQWLEIEVPKGTVTEVSAADKAEHFRRQQENFVSLSFDTISGSGPNGAIIHYKPTAESDRPVTTDQVYLVDSGAQYREGTTDTTRTLHLGTPTPHQMECFTRVLKGHINLASVVFPTGTKGHALDCLARTALWSCGLDYRHGTGHGVGAFLNVHEGPCGISFRPRAGEMGLEENMVVTDEPGYYEDGQFGIRIENCVKVIKAETKHNFGQTGFLTFEPITLVPIQTRMIDAKLLTQAEVAWLDIYHARVRAAVGAEMQAQGKAELLAWLTKATQPLA